MQEPTAPAETAATDTGPTPEVRTVAGDAMPAWVPRAIVVFLFGVAGLVTIRWLLQERQTFLVILAVSLYLSFALEIGRSHV